MVSYYEKQHLILGYVILIYLFPIFVIPDRTYDVAINHHRNAKISSLKSTYVQRAVDTALYIHTQEPPGDILVFLTGQNEIEKACLDLDDQARELNYRKDVK